MKAKKIILDDGQTSTKTPSINTPQGATGLQGVTGIAGQDGTLTTVNALSDLSDCQYDDTDYKLNIGDTDSLYKGDVGIGMSNMPNSSHGFNVALGYQNLYKLTSGYVNIGIGKEAQPNMTEGSYSIGIGYKSGANKYNSSGSICIGYNNTSHYLSLNIGRNTYSTTGYTIILGDNMSDKWNSTDSINAHSLILGGENITKTYLRGKVRIEDESTYSDIEGSMRYDSSSHTMKIYNGTSWVDL